MSQDVAGAPAAKRGLSRNGAILLVAVAALAAILILVPAPPRFITFLFVIFAWVMTVAVHEFCHALAAYRAGDITVAAKGYLSFDPLKYTDLATSLVLPILALALGGIGFPGGAVYLRDDLMRSRAGRSFASLAGPLGTLLCLVLLAIGFHVAMAVGARLFGVALAFLAFLQATGLVLNLLPIPGLDGFGVIRPFLPVSAQRQAAKIGAIAGLLLLGAIFFLPGVSNALFSVGLSIVSLLGIPPIAIQGGWQGFHFWQSF